MPSNPLGPKILARIIDGSAVPSFVIDRRHRIRHWNIALEALTGIKKPEIIGTEQQWRAFYAAKRPVMADLVVDGASPATIEALYKGKCRPSPLIAGAYEAEDFFAELGKNGKWLHFTASPIKGATGEVVGAIETLEDVTERKNAENNLRHYLREITRAQEGERKRIARDLHDDTTQVLASLSRQLDNFVRKSQHLTPGETLFFEDLQAQVNRGLASVRRFAQDLRPSILDDLGLIPAIGSMARNIRENDGIFATVEVLGEARRLPAEVESVLFRIIQEALTNVRKHAGASKVNVRLNFGQSNIYVAIYDNGCGFDMKRGLDDLPRNGKLGVAGMQERARLLGGTIEISSEKGNGTSVLVTVPA